MITSNKNLKILVITFILLFTVISFANAQYYPQSYNNTYYPQEQNYNNYQDGQKVILNDFQFCTASQKESQWCWAACITMVLNYYDIPCEQEEVVMNTYGMLVNSPARDMYQIADYLNGHGKTNQGKDVVVEAETYETASFEGIIEELQMGKPFIIGVGDGNSGHVVVCYGVEWTDTYEGPYVTNFYVYDPWPGNGNRLWNTEELNTYWMGAIGVDVNDGSYCNNTDYYNNQNYDYNQPYDYDNYNQNYDYSNYNQNYDYSNYNQNYDCSNYNQNYDYSNYNQNYNNNCNQNYDDIYRQYYDYIYSNYNYPNNNYNSSYNYNSPSYNTY